MDCGHTIGHAFVQIATVMSTLRIAPSNRLEADQGGVHDPGKFAREPRGILAPRTKIGQGGFDLRDFSRHLGKKFGDGVLVSGTGIDAAWARRRVVRVARAGGSRIRAPIG